MVPVDYDIWVMKEDGSQARSLTAGTPGVQIPTGVSPDGSSIAFVSDQGPNASDVWVMNADGTGARNLTPGVGGGQSQATFSPDGRRIAYVTSQAGTSDIYLMNVDGSGQAPVIASGVADSDPEFSPDGKSIVFESNRSGEYEVWKAGVDGSSPVNLTNFAAQFDISPTFSASGSRIAFTSIRDGDHDIWTMNADGSGQTNISNALAGQDTAAIWQALPRCGKSRATIVGDDGPDKIKGTKKRDVIVANGGKDKISGRGGNDRICGGKGKDRISGGGGDGDKCVGGKGNDSGSGCEKGKLERPPAGSSTGAGGTRISSSIAPRSRRLAKQVHEQLGFEVDRRSRSPCRSTQVELPQAAAEGAGGAGGPVLGGSARPRLARDGAGLPRRGPGVPGGVRERRRTWWRIRPAREDVVAVLDYCTDAGAAVIPFGGGTSVVAGVEPRMREEYPAVVTIDLRRMDRVLEVDADLARGQDPGGRHGPRLEDQLREHGLTLRHFPQSFEYSTLGGWIATRAGGHFATLYTHIDDLVESVRAVTPEGDWESRRLPGSGAGPSPDRMLIGSEGILA